MKFLIYPFILIIKFYQRAISPYLPGVKDNVGNTRRLEKVFFRITKK